MSQPPRDWLRRYIDAIEVHHPVITRTVTL